jgi:hypothetical protein
MSQELEPDAIRPDLVLSSSDDRALRSEAMVAWREIAELGVAAKRQGKRPVVARPPFGKLTVPFLQWIPASVRPPWGLFVNRIAKRSQGRLDPAECARSSALVLSAASSAPSR